MSPLTLSVFPFVVFEVCAAADATSESVAPVVEGSFAAFESSVFGPEGTSPFPAELLVVDAVSSMGDKPPIDCASFTTSWVICSAITICGSGVAADGALSEACSLGCEDIGGNERRRVTSCPCGRGRKSKCSHLASDVKRRHGE